MSKSQKILTIALRVLGFFSQQCSRRARKGLGALLGRILYWVGPRRRKITEDNVQKAFPARGENFHHQIVKSSYENIGIVVTELLAVPRLSETDIKKYVVFDGIEVLTERARLGKPSVLLSGHYGNWELLAMAGALHANVPFTIVVHPQKNVEADILLNSYRTKFGNIVVPMRQAAKTLISTMQRGGCVAFLADQHADPDKDAWIEFFGRPTPTYEAPAALALRYGAPLFAAYAVRQNDATYRADFHEVPSSDLTSTPNDVRTLTERHVRDLEHYVRENPGLWSWQHRRWRS